MQIVNDYDKEVYNGDIGRIISVDPDRAELVIRFDKRDVPYRFDELDWVALAYATTIHKSQGIGVPGRRDPGDAAAPGHAPPEPALHRRHLRQAPGHPGR
jgi:hypothetical protein